MEVAISIFIAVYLVEKGLHELELRRATKFRSELMEQIRSLEHLVSAKDLNGFMELQMHELQRRTMAAEAAKRLAEKKGRKEELSPVENGRYFEGNAPYEDPDNP